MSCNEVHQLLLSQQEEVEYRANGDEDYQRKHEILLDTSRLDGTQLFSNTVCHIRRAIAEEAIDNWQIKIVADRRTQSLCYRSEAMQETIDQTLIHPLIDKGFREPIGRFDEKEIIDFVKVVFVLEHGNL